MWGSDVRMVVNVCFVLSSHKVEIYEVLSGTFAANIIYLCFIQAQ